MIRNGMDIREATEAFTAMDAYGHPQTTIPKHADLARRWRRFGLPGPYGRWLTGIVRLSWEALVRSEGRY